MILINFKFYFYSSFFDRILARAKCQVKTTQIDKFTTWYFDLDKKYVKALLIFQIFSNDQIHDFNLSKWGIIQKNHFNFDLFSKHWKYFKCPYLSRHKLFAKSIMIQVQNWYKSLENYRHIPFNASVLQKTCLISLSHWNRYHKEILNPYPCRKKS